MDERCDAWLSKTHPPKARLKRSGVTRQKGPLSRRTPPRAMLMNKSRLNLYTSYLTQNSPPPPQLMMATRQSTLGDYFCSKGDKVKTRITEVKEIAPPSICCDTEEYQCEQFFQLRTENKHQTYDEKSQPVCMRAENKHQISDETNLTQNHSQNNTSDLPLSLHSSSILEDRHMNHNERDIVQRRQPLRTHKELDSSRLSCEKYFRIAGNICNKENCLHGCESECLFCRSNKESINCTEDKSKPDQGPVDQRLHGKNFSIDETEFISFSEGMKLLSQEPAVNDNCSHPLSKSQNQIWSIEDAYSDSKHITSSVSHEKLLNSQSKHITSSFSHERLPNSQSKHTASFAGIEGLSDSKHLDCVTQDTRSQCVDISHPFPAVKGTLNFFVDNQNILSPHAVRKQTRPYECVDKDTNVAKSAELARGLDSSEFPFTLPDTSDHGITDMRVSRHCRHLQEWETPDFVETFFTTAGMDSGVQSMSSQLSALQDEQFENRKAQYLLDLGTLVLSENIECSN